MAMEIVDMRARLSFILATSFFLAPLCAQNAGAIDHRLLATTRTSTMEKEMNEAADGGYVFGGLMGGKEVLVIMIKATGPAAAAKKRYKFLATSRTGTMEKELQQAGDAGFEYCAITAYKKEVAVVLERSSDAPATRIEYKLLATSRTGTMQKELQAAGEAGFRFRGLAFRGEVLSIMDRPAK
ncbi:MAG: hypothetical protein NTY38_21365 [Acidobacteria bacterium]|nr:hypothetical protein [Acidobacteriota bacterium]